MPKMLQYGRNGEDMLGKDGIQFFTVTFKDSDDKCGSAEQHAKELSEKGTRYKAAIRPSKDKQCRP
jgi:hypothetical protein